MLEERDGRGRWAKGKGRGKIPRKKEFVPYANMRQERAMMMR